MVDTYFYRIMNGYWKEMKSITNVHFKETYVINLRMTAALIKVRKWVSGRIEWEPPSENCKVF